MGLRLLFYKAYIAGIIIATLAGFIAGFYTGPSLLTSFMEEKESVIEALLQDPLMGALAIFSNNVVASLLALIPGVGLLVVGLNTAIIGSLASLNPLLLLFLVPHGVFEIPAIYYSVYLGGKVFADSTSLGWRKAFTRMAKHWAFIVVPLLLVAAFIEAYISYAVVKSVGG